MRLMLLCVSSVVCSLGMWTAAMAEPLNVLFIAADDLRCDLGCYGHPEVKTPHLDRLAQRGVMFTRAYCQQAVCNPSRASLLTGRRPDTLGIWNLKTHFRDVDPDLITLPQHFKRNGYFTQNIGKIFHNWHQTPQGDPISWSVPAELHFATHSSDTPQVEGELPPNTAEALKTERRDVPDDAYFDGRIATKAVTALKGMRDRKRKTPFFLAVGFWKPHLPFNPPARYWDLYDPETIRLPKHPDPPTDVPPLALHDGRELLRGLKRPLTEAEVRELRHGYLAGISYLDAQVGRILAELDRQKLTDKTVIVFWSDHGFHLGEHGLWCKTSNFELDARVPLIIVPPSDQDRSFAEHAGAKSQAPVELLDLYPTLVDLCDLPQPEGLEGVSLVPLLSDPKSSVKPAAYTQHPRPAYYKDRPEAMGVSVRTPRYRYTEWRDFGSGRVLARELYDHDTDPDETRNIIEHPPSESDLEQVKNLLTETFPRRGS